MRGSNSRNLVTIFGGSGFLGRHVVRAFAKRGYRVRVAVRRPDLAGHLQPLGGVGQIHAVQANLRNEESVARAVEGAQYVVNLCGILYGSGKQTFKAIHVEGAGTVARAAGLEGVQSLVHVSAIGADRHAAADYARTKGLGEEAVLREFQDAVILRPSIVFGPEDDFFNRFASLATISPVLPLVGGGRTKFQPVYVGDVAAAVVAATERSASRGRIYELGGPSIFTFKEILQKVLEYTDRHRMLVPLPFGMAKIQAFFLQLFPSPMLTVDQVKLLQSDNVVSDEAISEGRTLAALGVDHAQAVETIVPQYLSMYRPKGQFSVARN